MRRCQRGGCGGNNAPCLTPAAAVHFRTKFGGARPQKEQGAAAPAGLSCSGATAVAPIRRPRTLCSPLACPTPRRRATAHRTPRRFSAASRKPRWSPSLAAKSRIRSASSQEIPRTWPGPSCATRRYRASASAVLSPTGDSSPCRLARRFTAATTCAALDTHRPCAARNARYSASRASFKATPSRYSPSQASKPRNADSYARRVFSPTSPAAANRRSPSATSWFVATTGLPSGTSASPAPDATTCAA